MGYRAGVSAQLAAMVGRVGNEPHIYCDGCGVTRSVYRGRSYQPAAWFLNGKAAPGWSGGRCKDGTRHDLCPDCAKGGDDG